MKHLYHNPELKQINFSDQRFYSPDSGKSFFPSVSTILEIYPKGFGFDQWLKDVGNNATEIVERAGELGSKIHQLTELLNAGHELKWADENGNANYNILEWRLLLRFADFWKKCSPEIIASEMAFCSANLKFGGTLDRVVMIGGKRYLIDIKTSNYLHKTHELQQAAYAHLWNEVNPQYPIEHTGTLWLKANTRTDKIDIDNNIYQGISDAGAWQLKVFERHYTDSFKIFKHAQAIWEEENPNYKPANKIYPDFIKLENKEVS